MTPDLAVLLAGFVLAHAAWSVADLPPGELLVPLAVIDKGGQRQLLRFQSDTQALAIADGKATLAKHQANLDAWAFGREDQISEASGTVDVLTIDGWAKDMAQPVTFVQKFRRGPPGSFRLLGEPTVAVDGKAVEGAEASQLLKTLNEGIRQHPKAGALWQGWGGRLPPR
jgi:hypothetical protein